MSDLITIFFGGLGIFGTSLAVYGALRSDLAKAIVKAAAAEESASLAHKRIDVLMLRESHAR